MSAGKVILAVLVSIILLLALAWLVTGNDFFIYKVFAPKMAEARREVFEESKSYNEGMIQEFQNMQFEYIKEKDPEAKKALASIILHRAASYDLDKLPNDLYTFIKELKREQENSFSK